MKCLIAIFAFVVMAPAWAAEEQETIQWTRHTVQVTSTTPRGYAEYQNSCSVCHEPDAGAAGDTRR